MSIEERDVRALRDQIGGRCIKYGGSDATGTGAIGTVQYGKSDYVEDLFEEEEFVERTEGYDSVAYDLHFDYEHETDIRVHVSTLKDSVFIRTSIPSPSCVTCTKSMRAAKST